MDNWLVKARKAARVSKGDFAKALGLEPDEYDFVERHPGSLTLNQVGALSRAVDEEQGRVITESIAEIYA